MLEGRAGSVPVTVGPWSLPSHRIARAWGRSCVALLLGLSPAVEAQEPRAELIHFTEDGRAGSPLLFPGFRHDSVWSGLGAGSDGSVYVCVSNHLQPGGNVAVFRYSPGRRRMELLGDIRGVSTAAGNWMPNESQYKVHTFLSEHADGKLYFASMDHDPTPFLRGAHVYTIEPGTGTVTDFSKTQPFLMTRGLTTIPNPGTAAERSGVFIEYYGIKGMGSNPRAPDLLYAMTYPDAHLIGYELSTGAMEVVGQSTSGEYVFYVDNRGNAYYTRSVGAEAIELVKYVRSSGATEVVAPAITGAGLGAIAPTRDGERVYLLEYVTKAIHLLDCETDDVQYVTTVCGSNWWRLFNLHLDPSEEALWYVSNNNARSTVRRIDLGSGRCTEELDVDELLGTRNLCFGGDGVWDALGNFYAPVWTLGGADVALLAVRLGKRTARKTDRAIVPAPVAPGITVPLPVLGGDLRGPD